MKNVDMFVDLEFFFFSSCIPSSILHLLALVWACLQVFYILGITGYFCFVLLRLLPKNIAFLCVFGFRDKGYFKLLLTWEISFFFA